MNIFVLDRDVRRCARYTADKHIVKMVTETAQILSSAYYFTSQAEQAPYRLSHAHHPCCVWARQSLENWRWLRQLGLALYAEYRYRYGGRTHKAGEVIQAMTLPRLPDVPPSDAPLCMPDAYKKGDVVESYRGYYIGEKTHVFRWTKRDVPYWIPASLMAYSVVGAAEETG